MRFAGALVLALVAALTTSGCSQEPRRRAGGTPSRPASSAAPSTDLILDVDLDGRRMHVTCFGPVDESRPTVLFEAGGDTPSDTWDMVMDAVSLTHRACSYDRAGIGGSEPAPEPRRTTRDLVADLEATLDLAGIDGPFVLVSHSMAVWILSVYAAAHPDEVAGVVLVDPRGPGVSAGFRAALPPRRDDEPEAVRIWREEDLGAFEHDPTMNREHLDLTRSAAQASRVLDAPGPLFHDAPLIVLSASESRGPFSDLPPRIIERFDRVWHAEQQSLVRESTNGSLEVVPNSRHNVQVEQPQVVIDAIESVLAAASG